MITSIENPCHFNALESVDRFFIYGVSDIADRLQMMLCGRFFMRFYGFLYDRRTSDRHAISQFSLRYWKDTLSQLNANDFVFMVWRDQTVEAALAGKGIRFGLASNLVSIYSTYELPTFLHFCQRYLTKQTRALDIGGNTGLTSAMMASFSDHVDVFEPLEELIPVIKTTTEGLSNITIHNMAVFNRSAQVEIFEAGQNNSSLVALKKTEARMVDAVSIDDFCEDKNFQPGVIKIDVEGVDAEVILGGQKTILTSQPHLFFEHPAINSESYASNTHNIKMAMDLLKKYYDLYAYPTLDTYTRLVENKGALMPPLLPKCAISMPLDLFQSEYQGLPTNVCAIPQKK